MLLPDGRAVDVSRKPIALKILTTLFEGGGAASKEALAASVWGVADYHPLRDDKRLQVAISRLRTLLEDDAILETTEDGYRFPLHVGAYRV